MTAGQGPVILHADQEHGRLRLVIFLALFVGYGLSFLLVRWLLLALAPPAVRDYALFLSCLLAIPPALLLIWGLEHGLKRVWHSGLSLELDGRGITVRDTRPPGGGLPVAEGTTADGLTIAWAEPASQLNWYFRLSGYPRGGRERRVPKQWLCVATELYQDGRRLNVYSLMSPERAAEWIENPALDFRRLNPAEVYEHTARSRFSPPSRPELPNQLLHGKDGRHWLAERRRWEGGIELTPQDYAGLLAYVRKHLRALPALDVQGSMAAG